MFHVNLNYVDSRGRLKTGMCRSGGKINETFSVIKANLILASRFLLPRRFFFKHKRRNLKHIILLRFFCFNTHVIVNSANEDEFSNLLFSVMVAGCITVDY